ncbi:MAG TPA: DUF998 domain-containing protein [Acidimicrobiales bacterium]|nr:DUF998 domain-containing protein [Acidimicrobiales bacterium]
MTRLEPFFRRAAWGGVAGPVAFVSGWAVGGALRPDYSPVDDAISKLAAVGSSTRPLMTAGFVAFGVGVVVYAAALRKAVPGPAWTTAAVTGLATLGVASFPLDVSRTEDLVHGGLATLGYVTLASTPLLAARPLAASGRPRAAIASVATGVASGIVLAATVLGPAHGLLQRLGLALGDVWLVASASWILAGGHGARPERAGAEAAVRPR